MKKYNKIPPMKNSYWTHAATESRNVTAKTRNGHKHQQNRKKNSEQEKDKNETKNRKKENLLSYLVTAW